ncbi:MAG: hypothetical protein PHY46_05190 [Candidatus Omnitrophica bacterium]|nr:hypothetical protein [Candidatus Omnitrophota bacterium]
MISSEQKHERVNLICDSGMDFIWFLEDAYEQKDVNKFFSLVSSEFKKDLMKIKEQFTKNRLERDSVELYIHLVRKIQCPDKLVSVYNICWIKRFKRRKDSYWYREVGKAEILLKAYGDVKDKRFLLYDIYGDSPFN